MKIYVKYINSYNILCITTPEMGFIPQSGAVQDVGNFM